MARYVFKYQLLLPVKNYFQLPKGSLILSAGVQEPDDSGPIIVIWVLVRDPVGTEFEDRIVSAFQSGPDIGDDRHLEFIGTVTTSKGLVWHVFEEIDYDTR